MPKDIPTSFDGIIVRLRSEGESALFPAIVNEALKNINSKPTGKELLKQIVALNHKKKFGYTVCIMRPSNLSIVNKNDGKGPQWSAGSVAKRANETNACNGVGSVTAITWNANVITTPDGSRPTFIGLAHELIHALYSLKGEGFLDSSNEEYRTVGLPPVEDEREITENNIREEHGVEPRKSYEGVDPPPPVK
jgi:hypothetical protein